MGFSDFKKSRRSVEEMIQVAKQIDQTKTSGDDRIWKPTADKAGNGTALIRFVGPAHNHGDTFEYVKFFNHFFQGPTGKWYVQNSLSTLNQDDPVGDYNRALWNAGREDLARKYKRKLHYYANIVVLEDDNNPDAVGKVWIYDFGATVYDMIKDAMEPKFPHIPKINPFDFDEGANLRLMYEIGSNKQRTYAKSYFEPQSPLYGGDDKMQEMVYNSMHPLEAEIAPDKFRTYAELEAELYAVLGELSPSQKAAAAGAATLPVAPAPVRPTVDSRSPMISDTAETIREMRMPIDDDDDDDDDLDANIDFFKNMSLDD